MPDTAFANKEYDECGEEKALPYEIPELVEVLMYCRQRKLLHTNPEDYYNYYAANGWMVGVKSGNPRRMVDWKAHIRRWDAKNRERAEKDAATGGRNAAAEKLRALHEKFGREDGT